MGVKYTKEQELAINTLDKSILVAAAAGSGKTAVLVQRIINIILDGESNVDEMLVVTFTKAAAAEMRLKLAKAIKKRMQEDPDNRPVLRDQLNRLYRAYISTFDSFAVRVIKEFFYEIDIEPNFRACDEVQSALMQRAAIDELFEEAFAKDDIVPGASFREFLRLYSSDRSEESIKSDIILSYGKLRTMPNYFEWAYDKAKELRVDMSNLRGSELEKYILLDIKQSMEVCSKCAESLRSLYTDNGIEDKFYLMLGSEYDCINCLKKKADENLLDEEAISVINELDFISLQSFTQFFTDEEKDKKEAYKSFKGQIAGIRDVYKKELKDIRAKYFLPDFETRLSEMNKAYSYTVYYLQLLELFENKYQEAKRENGLLDFNDMEHMAVRILENEAAAEVLRKRFNYIFIDEYQDTNNIQEYLISKFARPDNVFKVGDVKQSIYRFRQAEPAIFERVYSEYSAAANSDAIAIDLNKNFRSNDKTINYINEIFRQVMPGYDNRAQLYTGLDSGKGYKDEYDFIPEVHVLYSDEPDDAELVATSTDDDSQDEIENLSKEEAEIEYIAGLINQIVGTEFCDTATGTVRRAEARDIAVLYRSVKYKGDILARALRNYSIDSHVDAEEDYFDTVEVGVAVSLFSCIDNMRRDVPLIATLHSEVFNWSPEDLAQLRIENREYLADKRKLLADNPDTILSAEDSRMLALKGNPPYWEILQWYLENGKEPALVEKAQHAVNKLIEWQKLSNMMPLDEFIWKVLVDSGYYMYAGAMYSGERRQANLRALVDRARKYSEESIVSLSIFLDFLNMMKSKKINNGQASMVSKDEDVVRITTIHKSKGLEYPFVIVAGMGTAFKFDGNSKCLSFDSELGVALSYVSPDRKYWRSTLMQRAISAKSRNEGYSEELRVLYVAMTRARNKLYLIGTESKEEAIREVKLRPNCFLDVIKPAIDTNYNKLIIKPLVRVSTEEGRIRVADILATRPAVMSQEASELYPEIDRRLSYKYQHEELLKQMAKYSVSGIRKEYNADREEFIAADDEVIKLWIGVDNKKKASATDIGLAYHRIMESIDFEQMDGVNAEEYLLGEIAKLTRSAAIDEKVSHEIDINHIMKFFCSELGKRAIAAARSGSLLREKPFTLRTEWKGQKVLVQGVIDCCWEEEDGMVLVDYKSSFIKPNRNKQDEINRIREDYIKQIDLYREAIEKGRGTKVKEAYLYLFMIDEACSFAI